MCVASEGYADHFVRKGVRRDKIVVTGLPNFDDCRSFAKVPFAHRDYVLVATSDARETFKFENRRATIMRAREIAAGRQLIFKLHPNEQVARARAEIRRWAPKALVYHGQPILPMIAHCSTLITKYSSCVYVGIALGKEVHSDFPVGELKRLCPIQNGGTSAAAIADVCEQAIHTRSISVRKAG